MKKLIAMLLVLVAVLSIVGCGAKTDPIEEAKSMLETAYLTSCGDNKEEYADLGYDMMSLVIDTDPEDIGYYSNEDEATYAIISINALLGLPSSITEKMSSTRALDGTQSQDCGTYTVTWNYHPDNGLKVIYEVNP